MITLGVVGAALAGPPVGLVKKSVGTIELEVYVVASANGGFVFKKVWLLV